MGERKTIDVVIYSSGKAGERLQRLVQDLVPKERLEVFSDLGKFSERLRRPTDDRPVAVILAASEDSLLSILSISRLLYDVRFILILPDREDPTVAIGHSLRPRFMSYIDSDFREVTAVLGKMIGGFYFQRKAKDVPKNPVYPIGGMARREARYKKLAP